MTKQFFDKMIKFVYEIGYPSESAYNFLKVTSFDKYEFYNAILEYNYQDKIGKSIEDFFTNYVISIDRHLFKGQFKIIVPYLEFDESDLIIGLRVIEEKIIFRSGEKFNSFVSFTDYLMSEFEIPWTYDDNESLSDELSHEVQKKFRDIFYLPSPDVLWV